MSDSFRAFLRFLSSLTFGGMLGGGLAGLIHSLWLGNVADVPFGSFVISGILLGSALHKPIHRYWRHFLGPIATLATSMIQIRKLHFYASRGLITPEKDMELIGRVIGDDVTALGPRDLLLPR